MFTRNRVTHHESGTAGRNKPGRSQRPRCVFSKEPRPSRCWRRGINISGVDFWHAVEFSRNGRFLRTHPHGLSSVQFPFGLAFPTVSDPFPIRFPRCFPVLRFCFAVSFPAVPILSEVLSRSFRPSRSARAHEATRFPCGGSRKRTGAGRLDANRGAPLRVHAYEVPYAGQTSTTTGRIIGLRR